MDPIVKMDDSRNNSKIFFIEKFMGRRSLGWPKNRWEENVRLKLNDTEIERMNWIKVTMDRDQWRACLKMALNLEASRIIR